MKVLVISGDTSFKSGNPRFDLQAGAVEYFEAVYWGRGALRPIVKGVSFDVVTSQDPFFRGLIAWTLARRFKARLNVQVHADIDAQNFIKHMIAQAVLRHADSIRVVSEKIRVQVKRIGTRAPVSVLPVFIDLERFRNIARHPDENPSILWVGRFEREKDPLLAIATFKRVREKLPAAKLVMLGKGSLEEKLRDAARGLPVEFPGWQDPVPFLARAHAVVSTSCAESWGASIIEALAAGVSVVAPDVGIAREAGAIVVPREKLADALIGALRTGPHPQLQLPVLSQEMWAQAWKKTL